MVVPIQIKLSQKGEILRSVPEYTGVLSGEQLKLIYEKIDKFIADGRKNTSFAIHPKDLKTTYLELNFYQEKDGVYLNIVNRDKHHFDVLINDTVEGIYTCSPQGKFTYVNPGMIQQTGYSEKELMKMYFWDIIAEDYRKEALAFYQIQFDSQTLNTVFEFPIQTKSGEIEWVNQTVTTVHKNGWTIAFQAVARFITDRVRMEEDLKQREYENLSLINAIDNDIIIVDNKTFQILRMKLNPSSPIRKVSAKLDLLFSGNAYLNDLPCNESSIELIEKKISSKDDNDKGYFNINLPSQSGVLYHILGNITPYGENKSIVTLHDLTKANLTLSALTDAKNKASATEARSENILATLGHEVRNPINIVLGMTNLLLENPKDSQQEKQLKAIKIYSHNALHIINNILDSAKLSANKIETEDVEFNMKAHVKELMSSVELSSNKKGIQTRVIFSKDVPTHIKSDKLRLGQILINLLSNAFKFTEKGEISINIKLIDTKKHKLEFSVGDTGIGIDPEKIATIFEPYTQASIDTTRKYGGTGLGLTIVKSLVELQDGAISVFSTPNKGSVFTFTLNYKPAENKTVKQETHPDLKVLIIEDEPLSQTIISNYLKLWEMQYDICEDGLCLGLLKDEPYDVILMDYHLGNETADTLISNLRSAENTCPVILVSGYDAEAPQIQGLDIQGVISKPIQKNRLYQAITRVVKGGSVKKIPTKLYDLSYLKESSLNDDEYVNKMIDMFVATAPEYITQIKTAHQNNDLKEIQIIAHKFKASINIMGIKQVSKLITTLEENIGGNQLSNLSSLIAGIEMYTLITVKNLAKLNNHSILHD